MNANLAELADKVEAGAGQAPALPVVAGFDGFVDEVIEIVGTRSSPESYRRLGTISDFGHWALESAGKSGLREFVITSRSAGGCTVNMGEGIATLGFPLDAFDGLGDPPDEVFDAFRAKCRSLDTLGMHPGRAIVSEFSDGKLMLCAFSHFAGFTPEYLREAMADSGYRRACERASGIALTRSAWFLSPRNSPV
jgi:hypothetical protein